MKIITADIPKKPAERRAWIIYQLRLRGQSLTSVARTLGVSQVAVTHAASGLPSLRIEEALAAALGVDQRALFFEHYDDRGERIPLAMGRPGQRRAAGDAVNA